MRCRNFFLWEALYIKPTNHWMPSGKIQRQKISSFKICLEAIGIRHLCWGDDSPAWDKKTTGEIIPSIQMKPGIEPSNVALNTSLLCSHGTKAAARTDRGFACSSERASCAKKHKWFASCLALSTAASSQSAHGVLWRLYLAARYPVEYGGLLWSFTGWESWFPCA